MQPIERESGDADYLNLIIEREFRQKIDHPLSQRLPINVFNHGEKEYEKVLPPYVHSNPEYAYRAYRHRKFDYQDPATGVGWKTRLNVSPLHVKEVADYLQSSGYAHKYLSGGTAKEGKIFTLYIGSFDLADSVSKEISGDILPFLARPEKGNHEREFSAGVVGKFVGPRDVPQFSHNGTCGYSILMEDAKRLETFSRYLIVGPLKKWENSVRGKAEIRAFEKLQDFYGDYFFPIERRQNFVLR